MHPVRLLPLIPFLCFTMRATEVASTSEYASLFQSFQKCLDLRDKYMFKSLQRLGDDPRDYDGHFRGLDDEQADVSGVRPDANYTEPDTPRSNLEPWKLFPPAPPPHWHWKDQQNISSGDDYGVGVDGFSFEKCEIPSAHPWTFEIDDKGVYQVYDNTKGEQCSCLSMGSCL